MPKGYHHLTRDQRCQLHTLKSSGESSDKIAKQLGLHRSAVYRELKRNRGLRNYTYQEAQKKASERKLVVAYHKRKMTTERIIAIEEKLRLQWSPEQISGWFKTAPGSQTVSHETIYKYVWENKRQGGSLYKNLRHQGKKYNKRGAGKAGRGWIPGPGHLQSPCEKFLTTEDTEKKDEIYCFLPRFAASVLSVFSVVRFFIWTLQVS